MTIITDTIRRLASRTLRAEANLQADIYLLLTGGELNLVETQISLESPSGDGTRRRLDVEIGRCVIEVKKDLRPGNIRVEGAAQLSGYLELRSAQLGTRYTGILTDGTEWQLYDTENGVNRVISTLLLDAKEPDSDGLLVWLESILATQESINPTPSEITKRLGATSPGHLLDHASLMALFARGEFLPEVQIKKSLWAKLLRTAFGEDFDDDPNVFVDHTLLVLTAEAIAHAAVGFDISRTGDLTSEVMTSGSRFSTGSQIHGVVESDFFDWVIQVPGGTEFVGVLKDRLSKFDWSAVEHDVLKHLYESVITAQARASLGEYYTPDWLADRMVADAYTEPLSTKALDPSCGSGTFLFHAVRAYLKAAESAGVSPGARVDGVTHAVIGMDIHPVAVTLARVTYLLAIGTDLLSAPDRGPISVPVYLGDSVQWDQHADILANEDVVTVETTSDEFVGGTGGGTLLDDSLIFPRRLLEDATMFDVLVSEMSTLALNISGKKNWTLIGPVLSSERFALAEEEQKILAETFATMRALNRTGRNHIWGYYVRNLLRPLWLATQDQRVDLLIGNPPWLRYNKMTAPMQGRYKKLAKARQLLTGGLGASARDLSTLFVVRSIELYLKLDGKFSFVMPHGTMSRRPHQGFRSGNWSGPETGSFHVAFSEAWDTHLTPTGFPMSSCVIRGTMIDGISIPLPPTVSVWSATTLDSSLHWPQAEPYFHVQAGEITAVTDDDNSPVSPYKRKFRDGAIIYPRLFFMVERGIVPTLGAGAGRIPVQSRRSSQEKSPFKEMPSLSGTVSSQYIRSVLVGENISAFRVTGSFEAVIPINDHQILTESDVQGDSDLSDWWGKVENAWKAGRRKTETLPLIERFDYHAQMTAQLPLHHHRVVYPKSGNGRLVAARLEGTSDVVDHTLFWAPAASIGEARYLVGILNSSELHDRIAKYLNVGNFGIRDVDKYVFNVPFAAYDASDPDHLALSALVEEAESVVNQVRTDGLQPSARRALMRASLEEAGISEALEIIAARILP